MSLAHELAKLSDKTKAKLARMKKASAAKLATIQREQDKKRAERILKQLPGKLRAHAKNLELRKYEVVQLRDTPPGVKPQELMGFGRFVFQGCREMGLDVRIEYSKYNDGVASFSCSAIVVGWERIKAEE